MYLSELSVNEKARVTLLDNDNKTKSRLNNIGLTKGVTVTLIRKAPLGDPIEIKVRDFYLALRLSDAQKIKVEKL